MLLHLATSLLACSLSFQQLEGDDLQCWYSCQDTSTEFATTNKQFSCPNRLYVDRKPIPWRDREFGKTKPWLKK